MPQGRATTGYAEIRPELTKDFAKDLDKKFQAVISSLKVRALEVDPGAIDVSKIAGRLADGVGSLKVRIPSMSVIVDQLDLQAKGIDATGQGRELGEQVGEQVGHGITEGATGGSMAGRFASGLKGMVSGGAAAAAGAALAAGAAAGVALGKGFSDALDREKIADKAAVGLGLKGGFAEGLKGEMSGIYSEAFGGDLADVGDAVTQVRRGLRGLVAGDEVDDITKQVITLRDVFGSDFSEVVRSAGSMVRNGLAPDVQTALDLITVGFQRGADQGGEFLESLNEYAQPVKDLGLSGEQFVASLISGAEQGVWSVDKVGDAFKELQVRAVNGTALTADSLKAMGLGGVGIEKMFAAGGDSAKRAMSLVVRSLKGMSDPLRQDAAGVGLFGTMWEDIGKDVIMSMDPATLAVEGFSGAAADAAVQAGDNLGTTIEGWKRSAQTKLADFADSTLVPAARRLAAAFQGGGLSGLFGEAQTMVSEWWAVAGPALGALAGRAYTWFDENKGAMAAKALEWGKGAVEWTSGAIGDLLVLLGQWLPQIGNWVITVAVPYIEDHASEWVDAFTSWVSEVWAVWSPKLGQFMSDISGWIWNTLIPWAQAKSMEWGMALLEWLGTKALPWVLEKLGALWDGIEVWLSGLPEQIRAAAVGLWDGFSAAFKEALNRIIGWWNELGFDTPTIEVAGKTLMESRRIDFPDVAPIMHEGGVFRAPAGQTEGFALLEDGERVIKRGGSAGTVNITVPHDRYSALTIGNHMRRLERARR